MINPFKFPSSKEEVVELAEGGPVPEAGRQRRRRTGWTTAVILMGALAISACGGGESSAPASANGTTLKVGLIPVAEFAPVYIALDEGYFEEEGLTVETQVNQNAAAIVPSVLNGQLQFGTAAATPFLAAVGKGLPLTAVANGSSVAPEADKDPSAIVVTADSGIERPKDLEGKTVAVNALGSISHVTAAAVIKDDGGNPEKTTFVAMPFPDMVAALDRDAITAATLIEPFQVQAVENGARAIAHPNSATLTPNGTFTLLFTSSQFAEQNPEAVAKFKNALDKASRAAAQDPSLVGAVLEKYGKLDPSLFEKMRLPLYSDDLNTQALQDIADLMGDLGLLDKPVDAGQAVWK